MADTARDIHAQEPVATFLVVFIDFGLRTATVLARSGQITRSPTRDECSLCTGKIVHELRAERARRRDDQIAIISVEQLVPFPSRELSAELARHSNAKDFVWVQEEPANMGARAFMMPRLRRLLDGHAVRSVRRSASASPATGSAKAHDIEQQTLLAMAFGT